RAWVASHGWRLGREVDADPDHGVEHKVIWWSRANMTLSFLEFHSFEVACVYVSGESKADVDSFAAWVEESLDTYRVDELLADAATTADPDDLADAVYRAGAGAPREHDERFIDALLDAFRSPEPAVREAAAWASLVVPWPEYRAALRAMRDSDEEPALREEAAKFLEAFDETGVPES